MTIMKMLLLSVTLVISGGCASSQKSTALPQNPNYSATPCAENCGTDPTCNASCMPLSSPGQPQPVTFGQ